MDGIRFQIVQQALVVGDDHCAGLGSLQFVEAIGYNAQSIYIKAGIRFVENGESRFQHSHLEYFVTFLLTAAEAFIHATVGKFVVQFDNGAFLAHQFQEFAGRQGGQMAVFTLFVDSGTHKVHHRNPRYIHRCLERKENTFMRTVFRTHSQKVLTVESYRTACHLVCRMSHQHIAQCTLSGSVLSHQGMHLTVADREVDAFQYLFAIDAGVQVFYL